MKQREQALAAVAAALGAAVEQGGSNRFFTLPGEGTAPTHVVLRPYGPVGVYVSTSRRPGEPYELLSERSHRLSLSPSSPRARLARAVFFPWRRTGDGDFDREVHVQSSLPWRRCAAFLAAGETRAAVRTLLAQGYARVDVFDDGVSVYRPISLYGAVTDPAAEFSPERVRAALDPLRLLHQQAPAAAAPRRPRRVDARDAWLLASAVLMVVAGGLFPTVDWSPILLGLAVGAGLFGLSVPLARLYALGRPRAPEGALSVLAMVLPLLATSALLLLNALPDRSPPVERRAPIVAKTFFPPRLALQSWRSGQERVSFAVGRWTYHRAREGRPVRLVTRAGFLGWEWCASIEPEAPSE